ncbi:MAG: tetratricopeptide repeat protein [Pseudomonadota bacterium]
MLQCLQKEAERAAAQTPPAPAPAPAPRVESLPPVVAAEAQGIKVERSSVPQRVNPVLAGAYAAYSKGEYESARQQYQAVLNNEASNRDALLGMAALSVKAGQDDQASAIYTRLLDANPADTDAQAGLAAVRGTDPEQAEQRLRRVIAKNPDAAPAVFALGNLFARQARWAEAQHQYFQAYTIDANNADYAFNLAIALDRLGQGKLAVTYYQRALALTSAGAANFDRTVVATRLRELGSPQ